MKNLIIFSFVTGIFIIGCKKVDSLTQFNMEFEESVVIESSTAISLPFNLLTPEIETNSESTFAVNDTRKDLIEQIILTDLELTLTSPSNEDFSFLESIEIFIAADELSDIRIAWEDDFSSSNSNKIALQTSGDDIKEYIKKDKFSLKLKTITDEMLSSDHHIDVRSVFFVDAKILGQ